MAGVRFIRRYSHSALVWAAIPLVVLNGRTVTGCGCFGHFKAQCCCSGDAKAQGGCMRHDGEAVALHGAEGSTNARHHAACCGHGRGATHYSASSHHSHRADGSGLTGQRCTVIVLHVVVPATVTPTTNSSDLHALNCTIAGLELSQSEQSRTARFVDYDAAVPPNDLVIDLHRLVI